MNQNDTDVMARTLYGEAEAYNERDAIAIACVIYNRVAYGMQSGIWPKTVGGVCLQPWQFSCWNPGDPNRKRILVASDGWFERCKQIASTVLRGEMPDPTRGGTHYYETSVRMPKWAKGKKPVYRVAHGKPGKTEHLFFNDIDTPPPQNAKEALNQIKPLAQSKTIKGSQVAGIATAGSIVANLAEPSLMQQVSDGAAAASSILPLAQLLAEYAPAALGLIALIAIGYIVYVRIEERRKGKS